MVIGKDGRKEVFPGGKDTTLISKTTTTDENGKTQTQEKIYYVDKEGNASEPQAIAQGGKPSKDNTQGVDKNGIATDISAKGIEVFFENTQNSKYAFEAPNRALTQDYKKIDGKFIPFKAVIKGESEEFLAKVVIKNKEISADSLIFKTQKDTQIQAQRLENSDDYLLNIKGLHSLAVEQVQATIKQGKKYQIAGVFNLVHLSPRTQKVKLIPTSQNIKNVDIEQIKQIYSKVGVDLQIETESVFDISNYLTNNVLETKDVFGDLTDYSPAQQQIITQFRNTQNIDNQAYYLFLTDAKSSTGQGGYMALGGQFGFVFNADNQVERTIAHELGHGIFKLEHPFKDKTDAGKTTSIMDYGSGMDFLFPEWKQIGDPEFKIGIFQEQGEGEYSDDDILHRISEAMHNLGSGAFLKCKECESYTIKPQNNIDKNIVSFSIDEKRYYKCILGEVINGKVSCELKGLNKNLSTNYDKKELGIYYEALSDAIKNNKKNSFLLVTNNHHSIECTTELTFSDNFCDYQKNSKITNEDKEYITNELEHCLENNKLKSELEKVLSQDFYKEIKLAVRIKYQNGEHILFSKGCEGISKIEDAELVLDIDTNSKENLGVKNIAVSDKYLQEYVSKLQIEAKKRGINADIDALRKEVIKDLEDKQTIGLFAQLAQKAKALYSEQVGTFAEAVLVSQKIAKNVWDEGQINQSTWYSKSEEHQEWPKYAQFAPSIGGGTDGLIDEVFGIPLAIKGLYEIMADEAQRAAIAKVFTQEGISQLWKSLASESLDILNDEERLTHFGTKSMVQIAGMVASAGITKGGKMVESLTTASNIAKATPTNVATLLNKLKSANRYNREILSAIDDLFTKIDPAALKKLVNVPGFDKVLEDMATHWKKFKGGKFQLEYFSKKIENLQGTLRFEVPQTLIIDGNEVARVYDATVEYAGKITKYELKNWAGWYPSSVKKQFIKDIQNIEKLDELKWVFNTTSGINKNNLKEKIISTLKKADGKPIEELKGIDFEKAKKLFNDDLMTEQNYINRILKNLEDDKIFNQIFEIAE